MKRLLTSAAAAAVMVAGTGSDAQAQGANAHLFDLALGIGGAYHYNWLEKLDAPLPGVDDIGDRLNPGFAPIFTGAATFWTTPSFGIRTNLAYSDIDLPDGSQPESVNGWFYDLNLMFRPWIERDDMSLMMSSMYFFLGGGGFTSNPPGDGGCVEPYGSAEAICLPLEGDKGTVGQGTAGLGFDLMSLASNIGLFTELGLYGYDSPFHDGPGWTGRPKTEHDAFSWTGRLTAGLKFGFGELIPVVVPPPVTPPPPPPPPVTPAPPAEEAIRVCVVQGTMLTNVDAIYIPARGDTVVMVAGERRPFATVYPSVAPDYAAGETWYINNDSITVMDTEYVRFGVPRVISSGQLTRVGDYEGVGVYAETGADTPYSVIYVPLRPGCEFQPYQQREIIRVRG